MNSRGLLFFFFTLFYSFGAGASSLMFELQHYTSAPALKSQLTDYALLKWDQKTDFHKGFFYFDSHIQAEYGLDRSEFRYFNIPELYFFYKYDLQKALYHIQSIELNVGRKIKIWSIADEYWDMGLWNPLSRWNPLHPQTSGLVGSFLTLKARQWTADFFLGALHFPNQETQTIQKDRAIYSHSRWFSPLPHRVDVLNIDIHYFTHKPFIINTLFQQSYLLNIKTWSEASEPRYWMKWSIADKPVNHLFFVLNKTKLFHIGQEEGAVGNVHQNITILPVRQRLLSSEWGLDYKNVSAVFTLENSKMKEEDIPPEDWDFLNLRGNFTYFSTILKYNFSSKHFVRGAYIKSWFKNYDITNTDNTGEKHPSILRRYKVLEGIGLDWQTEFVSSRGLKRILTLNYCYSFLNEGSWLFVKALYYISPKIYTGLTFDILGAKNNDHYFLGLFRHNDYFAWSLAYDF